MATVNRISPETERDVTVDGNRKKEDQDFIVRFLTLYKGMNEENQNLVLAFVKGMEFQHELGNQFCADQDSA